MYAISCSPHYVVGVVIDTAATATAAIAIAISPIPAHSRPSPHPVDAEPLVGFTNDADLGSEAGKEFVIDSTLRDDSNTGSIANTSAALEFKYPAMKHPDHRRTGSQSLSRDRLGPWNRAAAVRWAAVLVLGSALPTWRSTPRSFGIARKRRPAFGSLSMKRAACEPVTPVAKPSRSPDHELQRRARLRLGFQFPA